MTIFSSDYHRTDMHIRLIAAFASFGAACIFAVSATRVESQYLGIAALVVLIFFVLGIVHAYRAGVSYGKMREENHRFSEYSSQTSTKMNHQDACDWEQRRPKVSTRPNSDVLRDALRSRLGFSKNTAQQAADRLRADIAYVEFLRGMQKSGLVDYPARYGSDAVPTAQKPLTAEEASKMVDNCDVFMFRHKNPEFAQITRSMHFNKRRT